MSGKAKYGWIPVAIVLGGIGLHMAPAGLALADQAAQARLCPQTEQPVVQSQPERAAELASAVLEDPEQTDCVLQGYGMDRQGFIDLMDEIAADPRLAQAYTAQLEQSGQVH